MKRTALQLLLIILTLQASAQTLEGVYRHQNDSIALTGKEVTFSISGFGALTNVMVGLGTFEQVDNFLLIHTTDYRGDKTLAHTFDGNIEDTLRVQVTSLQNYPTPYALVDFVNAKGRLVERAICDENGRTYLHKTPKQIDKISKIKVSSLGYDTAEIDFDPNKDYLIKLAENRVIENQTLVFELKDWDVASISVVLIDEDFKEGKNRMKSLQRLSKRAAKRNVLGKVFRREYDGMFEGR